MTTLKDLFHSMDPPELSFKSKVNDPFLSARSTTRSPNKSTATFFERLPNETLRITHDPSIIRDLENLVSSSWSEAASSLEVRSEWTALLEVHRDVARLQGVGNEVIDLTGVFVHQLFGPVNLVASRAYDKLKPEAYPRPGLRSAFTPAVGVVSVWGDHYATLTPVDSLELAENRVVVEKKLPSAVKMSSIVSGVMLGVGVGVSVGKGVGEEEDEGECEGEGEGEVWGIVHSRDVKGNDLYHTRSRNEADVHFVDAIQQVSQLPSLSLDSRCTIRLSQRA